MSNRSRALIAFMAFATVFLVMVAGVLYFLFSSWLPCPTSIARVPGSYEGDGPFEGRSPAHTSVSLVLDRQGTYVQKVRTGSGRSFEATGTWRMIPQGASRGQVLELDGAWEPIHVEDGPPPRDGYQNYVWAQTRMRVDLYYSLHGPILRAGLEADEYIVNLYPQ